MVSCLVVSCQSVCPQEDYKVSPITGESEVLSVLDETSEPSPKPEIVSAKDSCECAAASQRAAITEEAPKTEQAIIKKAGKKYKVITITLPVEVDGAESSKETTDEPVAFSAEQLINELSSTTETSNYEDFFAEEKDAEPQKQEEVKKEKVKVEKRKYKRDVGKKSASKKSSKRKNKEQGKKKSKK